MSESKPPFKVQQSCGLLGLQIDEIDGLTPEMVVKSWKSNVIKTHSNDDHLINLNKAKEVLLDWLKQ